RRQVPGAGQRGRRGGGDGAGARRPASELDPVARARRRIDDVVSGHAQEHAVWLRSGRLISIIDWIVGIIQRAMHGRPASTRWSPAGLASAMNQAEVLLM